MGENTSLARIDIVDGAGTLNTVELVKYDTKNRSRVRLEWSNAVEGTVPFKSFRFKKIEEDIPFPYLSWASLLFNSEVFLIQFGFVETETFFKYFLQHEKAVSFSGFYDKKYAGDFINKHINTKNDLKKYLTEIAPKGYIIQTDYSHDPCWFNYCIYRKGTLADYFDLDSIFEFYTKLDISITDKGKRRITALCSNFEIQELLEVEDLSELIPCEHGEQQIVMGLLKGIPPQICASCIEFGKKPSFLEP